LHAPDFEERLTRSKISLRGLAVQRAATPGSRQHAIMLAFKQFRPASSGPATIIQKDRTLTVEFYDMATSAILSAADMRECLFESAADVGINAAVVRSLWADAMSGDTGACNLLGELTGTEIGIAYR
jgi:hypothetical protein